MTTILNAVSGTGLTQTADGSGILQIQSNGVNTNAQAWVTFTGSTGAINGSYNVSSVSRTGTGNYTVNFTNALNSAQFCPLISISNISLGGAFAFDAGPNLNSGGYTGYASTSYFKFITGNINTSVPSDPAICSVSIFR